MYPEIKTEGARGMKIYVALDKIVDFLRDEEDVDLTEDDKITLIRLSGFDQILFEINEG